MADSLKPLISTQPGERSRLWPALANMLRQFELRSDQLLPAKVISYDRDANVVTVQPMIMLVTTEGATISRHPLAQLPALCLGAGGFFINFPIQPGNLGWIFAADRDITLFLQSLSEAQPNTTRAHRFEDAMFIPDAFRDYVINGEDTDALVIGSADGATRISIRTDNIKVTAPVGVTIDTPLTTVLHDMKIGGNLEVDGTGNVHGVLTNNGINVTTHGHVSSSPGNRTGNMEA